MSGCANTLDAKATEAAIIAGAITRNRSRECALRVPSESMPNATFLPPVDFLVIRAFAQQHTENVSFQLHSLPRSHCTGIDRDVGRLAARGYYSDRGVITDAAAERREVLKISITSPERGPGGIGKNLKVRHFRARRRPKDSSRCNFLVRGVEFSFSISPEIGQNDLTGQEIRSNRSPHGRNRAQTLRNH
jgi:hypothetical protein